jgi:5-methylcytosine-specific restriction endonuclease McrA
MASRAVVRKRGFPVPPWQSDSERNAIDQFYLGRPPGAEVDHICPLKHPEVVGLHVRPNLQYLSPEQNSRKGNSLPEHVTPAQAVEMGIAVWRRDVAEDGTVNWGPYRPVR